MSIFSAQMVRKMIHFLILGADIGNRCSQIDIHRSCEVKMI